MRSLTLATLAALALLAPAAHAQPAPDFDGLMAPQGELQDPVHVTPARPWTDPAPPSGASIDVPLPLFDALWRDTAAAAAARSTGRLGPAVVLGAADYRGEAEGGALHLDVTLALTLGRPGAWKTVPLVGEGAVLVSATVDDAPAGVTTSHGYHVWLTQRTGEVTVRLAILVPPTGPRGSIEYDLVVPRTPTTAFTCAFPVAGLEPRVDDAVRAEVLPAPDRTTLSATLRPTTRIHLVGFRDLGDTTAAKARVYAESMNLLSVDDGALELFAELRYTILYAPTKRFEVLVPAGLTVVSADGRGAFRYELAPHPEGTLLTGETAYPMRDDYAISLRLKRELKKGGERFPIALPRTLGVERDAAWLAVEVPGKLQLEEAARGDAVTAIDTRQLPPALIKSAVSPILRAYRFATAQGALELAVTRLPERDIASESIDRASAQTVVTADGATLTELRLTLRNRLRPGLALTLPPGAEVRSVLLDGAPTKPSRDEAGRLLLPLKRSSGAGAGLAPITLQLVYAHRLDPFGWVGWRDLALPAIELPIASLDWEVHLPVEHRYGAFAGDVDDEATEGRWSQPTTPADLGGDADASAEDFAVPLDDPAVESAETGAMPVRITLPAAGIEVRYHRYWVPGDTAVRTRFTYVASALPLAVRVLLAVLVAVGAWLAASRRTSRRARLVRVAGFALAIVGVAGLVLVGGAAWGVVMSMFAWAIFMVRRGIVRRAGHALRAWGAGLPARYRDREGAVVRPRPGRVALRVGAAFGLILVGLALLDDVLLLLDGLL